MQKQGKRDMIRYVRQSLGLSLIIMAAATSVAAGADAESPSMLQFMRQRENVRYDRVPREVLGFYYTWYGRPERQGHWVHWGKVDAAAHEISESTHYPARGAYDSHDPEIMDWHIDQARRHGLTGFIATWWGQGSYDDRAFATLLERAADKDFKVTVYWETAPGEGAQQIERAVDDLLYVLQRYGTADAFLKVDGKPVVFVYGRVMGQVPMKSWPAIINGVRGRYGREFLLIADGYSEANARLFDGVHTYNICGWVRGKSPEELRRASADSFSSAVQLAKSHGKISCITIIPGYDDTKIREPGLRAERHDGKTYQVLWKEAVRADPDWVLITSWNEWHEGSEIEPSWEHGDKYLQLTKPYADRFRATPYSAVAVPETASGLTPEQAQSLRDLYRGRAIGVLPNYAHRVVFWLADAGIELKELSWQDVLDPQLDAERIPILLYAGDEHYVRTVQQDGDVIKGLQRYLAGGGLLMAFCHQPYPFFYDETGRPNNAAGQLGFPIVGSRAISRDDLSDQRFVRAWESPPPGVELTFQTDRQRLPGLLATAAFPTDGDRRWRPATEALVADGDRYLPLARLVDAEGRVYGDGIVYVEHRDSPPRGGRNLYVWMRMADVLGADAMFLSLFRLSGEL